VKTEIFAETTPEPDPAPAVAAEPISTAPQQQPFEHRVSLEMGKPVLARAGQEPRGLNLPVLVVLALVGLAVLAVGITGAMRTRDAVVTGLFNPFAVHWLMGVAGVALFAFAAYLIFDRLGRDDDDFRA
jgi:hypothetical protein